MFLVEKCETEYFVWSAIDDIMLPRFIEKTMNTIESNKEIVGCITQITYYDHLAERNTNSSSLHSLTGNYQNKIKKYLKNPQSDLLYCIFRAEKLKKCIVTEPVSAWDSAVILLILQHGEIQILNESLLRFFAGGISSKDLMTRLRSEPDFNKIHFPASFFLFWCVKHLGWIFFLKNPNIFFKLLFDLVKIILKGTKSVF
jgi:hypothetical protein